MNSFLITCMCCLSIGLFWNLLSKTFLCGIWAPAPSPLWSEGRTPCEDRCQVPLLFVVGFILIHRATFGTETPVLSLVFVVCTTFAAVVCFPVLYASHETMVFYRRMLYSFTTCSCDTTVRVNLKMCVIYYWNAEVKDKVSFDFRIRRIY